LKKLIKKEELVEWLKQQEQLLSKQEDLSSNFSAAKKTQINKALIKNVFS
jgi:hypothetical protein